MKESKWNAEHIGKETGQAPQRALRGSQSSAPGGGGSIRSAQLNIKTGGKSVMYRKESAGAGTPAQVLRFEDRNSGTDHLVAYGPMPVKIFSSIASLIFKAFTASTARFRFASPI